MTKVHLSDGALELLVDQIPVLKKKEVSFYSCIDYLKDLEASSEVIDYEKWRQEAAKWMFTVVDSCDLCRDIVSIGMAYLDQMLAITTLHRSWGRDHCCIVAIASLKLAIKLNVITILKMEDMLIFGSYLRPGEIKEQELIHMEHRLLWELQWNVASPTTPFLFVNYMICMLPKEVPASPTRYMIQEIAKYITELAVCVYSFVKYLPSRKGYACCLVAIESLDDDCIIRSEIKNEFFGRIFRTFEINHDEEDVICLKEEFHKLLCQNTDVAEFARHVRAVNRASNEEHDSESPRGATSVHF